MMSAGRYFLEMFGVSLGLTLLFELTFSVLFGVRTKKGLLIVFLVNVLTNPVAVFLCYIVRVYLPSGWYLPIQLFLEVMVVFTEGMIYRGFRSEVSAFRRPFLLSLSLNAISYGLGILYNLLR